MTAVKDKGEDMTNYEKLMSDIRDDHKPFIVSDIETTGVMNGNDNRITQVALVAYKYEDGQYRLQDKIFMLAKADKKVLDTISSREMPTSKNATTLLEEEYAYSLISDVKRQIRNCEGRLETARKNNRTLKIETEEANLKALNDDLETLRKDIGETPDIYRESDACTEYVKSRLEDKVRELNSAPKLSERLSLQGIDRDRWQKSGEGLNDYELQVGITKFMEEYTTPDTVVLTNGNYFQKHYMEKQNLSYGNDNLIDLNMVQKSKGRELGDWTPDLDRFAEAYRKDTGKEIKVFDGLTKALCYAEIAMKAVDLKLTNTSKAYLENAVKEEAFKHDDDYVMSISALSRHNWVLMDAVPENFNGYTFNSLEYVNFGNDRRYIDLDTMFRVNDDFEITLEGEKEPIKTWEELEAKIKALNADISEELLKKIEDRYEEIKAEAEFEKEASKTIEEDCDEEYTEDYDDGYDEGDYDEDIDEDIPIPVTDPVPVPTYEETVLRKLAEMSERMEGLAKEKADLEARKKELDACKVRLFEEKVSPLAETIYKLEQTGKYGTLDTTVRIEYARPVTYHLKAEKRYDGYGLRIVFDADYDNRKREGKNPYSMDSVKDDMDNLSTILKKSAYGENLTADGLYSRIADAFTGELSRAISDMEKNNGRMADEIQALEEELEEPER